MRRSPRPIILTLALSVSTFALTVASKDVQAQATDSQRSAARLIFQEGDTLQKGGHFAEALDKFQRAEAVFHAPTNQLRIAECEVALGKLLSAAEEYRTIIRTPLPDGSPPAFVQAVKEAQTALAQVEPRIPHLTIVLAPPSATGFDVRVDGEVVNPALIGEPIPLNPGTHIVSVGAKGYTGVNQSVTLKEGETVPLRFRLRTPTAPGTLAPAPAAPNSASPRAEGQIVAETPEPAVAQAQPNYPAPPPPSATAAMDPPPQTFTPLMIGLKVSAALALPIGGVGALGVENQTALMGPGYSVAIDVGVRLLRSLYLGGSFDYAVLGGIGNANVAVPGDQSGTYSTSSTTTIFPAAVLGYFGSPDHTGFYGEIGVGYRQTTLQLSDSGGATVGTATLGGPEVEISGGVWVPIARTAFGLMPKVTGSIGTYTGGSYNETALSNSGTLALSSNTHAFVGVGLEAYYTLAL